ncbi:MAG: hypothetical protein LBN05_01615 [Oscillospiraceae bacterium]|jgi:hypothetical protein|nr:hypothetical protein [Oscillospiraceae bacterium]
MDKETRLTVLFVALLFALVDYASIRLIANAIIHFVMNKSSYNKTKKGQSFWEWLTHKRFRVALTDWHRNKILAGYALCGVGEVLCAISALSGWDAPSNVGIMILVLLLFAPQVYEHIHFHHEKPKNLRDWFWNGPSRGRKLIAIDGVSRKKYYALRKLEKNKEVHHAQTDASAKDSEP